VAEGKESVAVDSLAGIKESNFVGILLLLAFLTHSDHIHKFLARHSLSIEPKCCWYSPVAYPIGWSASLCVWKVYCGKMAECIRMLFGVVSAVGRGMGVLDRVGYLPRELGSFGGKCGAFHCKQWRLCCVVVQERRTLPKLLCRGLVTLAKDTL